MQKSTLALAGFIILIVIAIGLTVILPDTGDPEHSAVKAVPDAGSGMQHEEKAENTYPGRNAATSGKNQPAGAEPGQEPADMNNAETPAPSSSAGVDFSGNEAGRPSDEEVKRYIELKKETLAMQKGPEALEHYYDLKQGREQKALAREEYRKQRREYDEQRREWKLMLEQAEEYGRTTGDFSQVDELRSLEPVRPKRHPDHPVDSKQE